MTLHPTLTLKNPLQTPTLYPANFSHITKSLPPQAPRIYLNHGTRPHFPVLTSLSLVRLGRAGPPSIKTLLKPLQSLYKRGPKIHHPRPRRHRQTLNKCYTFNSDNPIQREHVSLPFPDDPSETTWDRDHNWAERGAPQRNPTEPSHTSGHECVSVCVCVWSEATLFSVLKSVPVQVPQHLSLTHLSQSGRDSTFFSHHSLLNHLNFLVSLSPLQDAFRCVTPGSGQSLVTEAPVAATTNIHSGPSTFIRHTLRQTTTFTEPQLPQKTSPAVFQTASRLPGLLHRIQSRTTDVAVTSR